MLVSFWFQTDTHSAVSQGDDASCGHAGADSACACVCHASFVPAVDTPAGSAQPETAWTPASDETVCGLLLPVDIFRPPLTNS